MLPLAIEAQLPLIGVTTRDVLNLHEVLRVLTKKPVVTWQIQVPFQEGIVYTYVPNHKQDLPLYEMYQKLVKAPATLILVNPKEMKEPIFNAGELAVPKELMHSWMKAVVEDDKKASDLLKGLGGCTLKEAAEYARLTMARDHSLTSDGLMVTRRSSFMGASGLTPVDSKQDFYEAPDSLEKWVAREANFFLNGSDPRLIPRGLLFDGPPGTGKTSGAKWLAERLGVPLYRMDIGGTKSKWVGESEGRLLGNLLRIDNEAPAVVLLDEIEKVFATNHSDSSGTTATMLSQLLWWLAERRSRILVVMTTNNSAALPKELYREGRVDEVFWMNGLNKADAITFVRNLMKTFPKVHIKDNDLSRFEAILKSAKAITGTSPEMWAHSALTKATYQNVKTMTKGEAA